MHKIIGTHLRSIATVILFIFTFAGIGSAQNSGARNRQVKAAAESFYRTHLSRFGFTFEPDIRRLRPYLSPNLSLLLKREVQRMRDWSVKNPNLKPPVIEDVFVCNHYEKPQNFRVLKTSGNGRDASATIKFNYIEKGKVVDKCNVDAKFVHIKGKWLLNNVIFESGPDLLTLLSRQDYHILPE
jgi:hypothetical protein